MDTALATTIISTSGAVSVGIFGMWINAKETGKRINEVGKRIDDLRNDIGQRIVDISHRMERLEDEFRSFKDMVNSKLGALDFEIAKQMDRPK